MAGELGRRLTSGLALAAGAFACAYLGGPYFEALVALAALVLAWEWAGLCGGRGRASAFVLAGAGTGVVVANGLGLPGVGLGVACAGALAVYGAARLDGGREPLWQALGALYIGLPATALLWLRAEHGAGTVLWLMAVVAASDIGAYAVGRSLGGPKFAPRLSPHKTRSGVAGGLASAALAGAAAGSVLDGADGWTVIWLALALSVAAQAGDLAESGVKRRFGVKDMSHLIPGHGGLFDRVDGLLVAAPALALAVFGSGGSILAWR
ncbi:MAG: phosphatidate cytidylyltransferase [Alphaproteobacteria bacterium]